MKRDERIDAGSHAVPSKQLLPATEVIQLPARRRFAWLAPLASAVLFSASLVVLYFIVSEIEPGELRAALTGATVGQIGLAVMFAAISYLLLTGYDALALLQLRLKVPYRTTAFASFASYAVSFNLGFPLLTGGTVRYWIYAPKGLRASRVATLTVIAGITFWLGMGMVLGWSLLREADELAILVRTPAYINRMIGVAAIAIVVAYLVWVSLKPRAVTLRGWRLDLPGLRLSLGQALFGIGDVCAAAAVLYVLMPEGHGIGYEVFLAVYVFAVMLGIASHSPGGLGVFEATMLLALSSIPTQKVLGALLLFRICYYFIPFIIALAMLGGYEIRRRLKTLRPVLDPRDEE